MTPTEQQVYAAAYGAAFVAGVIEAGKDETMTTFNPKQVQQQAAIIAHGIAIAAIEAYRADHPAEGSETK